MSRVHAFVDDALGDLDAVALADAIRSGRVGRADVVEAAIARAEAVNPALNALAYAAFDVARDAAAMGTGQEAFFSGVPTFIKDNVDVAGQPSMHGTDAWEPYAAVADSEITRVVLGTGLVSLGKTQLSNSASAPWPNTLGWDRSVIRGIPTTQRVPPHRDRAPWWQPAWCRSRTPTTAAARSVFRPPATGWSGSSRRAAGCRWSRSIAGCRWASSPMAS